MWFISQYAPWTYFSVALPIWNLLVGQNIVALLSSKRGMMHMDQEEITA